jgi:hypothetical protein
MTLKKAIGWFLVLFGYEFHFREYSTNPTPTPTPQQNPIYLLSVMIPTVLKRYTLRIYGRNFGDLKAPTRLP